MKHNRVTLVLLTAVMLLTGVSCSTSRKSAAKRHSAKTEHTVVTEHLSKERRRLLDEAQSWIGTPYKYAHSEKGEATDCSGFVMMAYLEATGRAIPRNSAKQAEFCHKISQRDARPGDLVFFATGKDPRTISHVGILLDSERFIHASSKLGVTITGFSNQWYAQRLIMFGRILN